MHNKFINANDIVVWLPDPKFTLLSTFFPSTINACSIVNPHLGICYTYTCYTFLLDSSICTITILLILSLLTSDYNISFPLQIISFFLHISVPYKMIDTISYIVLLTFIPRNLSFHSLLITPATFAHSIHHLSILAPKNLHTPS